MSFSILISLCLNLFNITVTIFYTNISIFRSIGRLTYRTDAYCHLIRRTIRPGYSIIKLINILH